MSPGDLISSVSLIAGALFFLCGTVGLLRFPDVYTRLHALTKADNVGLGLIVLGLIIQSGSFDIAIKLLIIWFLVLIAGASVSQLIANGAQDKGIQSWKKQT